LLIFIVGPTAIGKSEIACLLAAKINAEIVSCDSMQIYKGMEIITSKPDLASRKKIAHHLMGVVSVDKEYDVSRYRKEAVKKIKEIIGRERIPVFVGGTGLYMSVLIDGIFNLKPPSRDIRINLYKQAEALGIQKLYARLEKVDSEAAQKIHPHDAKRIIRALEVFESAGESISSLQKQRKGLAQEYSVRVFGLNMAREKLYARINTRTEDMFQRGLVKEVKRLLKLKLSKTAAYAIGIREIKGYLDGEYDLDEAKRLIQRNTRIYAKRQFTWFRKDKRIEWVEISDNDKPEEVVSRILQRF